VLAGPQYGALTPGAAAVGPLQGLAQAFLLPRLTPQDVQEWHAAVAQAAADGTLAAGQAFHCAVGRKP
jgi:hypothetical protein